MTSFAQTLRSYSVGSLSREDLFHSLEAILAEDRVDTPWLLKILDQEQREVSLPQEVYDAVRRKVIEATPYQVAVNDGNGANIDEEDLSSTQMATSFFLQAEQDDSITTDSNLVEPRETSELLDSDIPIKGVGDVLNGRFELEERVGSGGMSTVYRALDRRKLEADDREPYIAVKILNLEFRAHPDSLIALQREAKKCHKLAHPNIVRAYDFDRDGPTVYMTMEYLTGHSLAKVLRDPGFKGMSFEEALPIIRGMAEALSYAHKNGIVHADFKPANVILTDSGEVKVIDFGIARAFHKQGEADMEVTRFDPGSLGALTPTYASPEMLEHKEADPRDDVYALACIVYEMLTGRHPFGRRQANEARDGGLALQRKTLSRRQWRALKSALQFDRDKRTPSVSRFFTDINPEYARTPILIVIITSVLITATLIGMGAIIYDNDDWLQSLLAPESETPPAPGAIASVDRPVTAAPAASVKQMPKVEQQPASVEPVRPAVPTPVAAPTDQQILESVRAEFASFDCAALSAEVSAGKVVLSGYLGESRSIPELTGSIQKLPGVNSVDASIAGLSKSMCGVVDLYRPYWLANQRDAHGAAMMPGKANAAFVGGEPLMVKLKTPGYASYVKVDYYTMDGHVVHMVPGPRVKQNQAPANYSATLGDLGQWIVSEPYGRELVVMLTSPLPVFPELREEYETTSDYLAALSQRLDGIQDERLKKQIAADFLIITTRAK